MLQLRRNYEPFPELFRLRNQMDRMFDDTVSRFFESGDSERASWTPAVDVVEEDDRILVRAELPGLTQDDIELTVENNQLTLKGEKRFEETSENGQYRRIESRYGHFIRQFPLPSTVDQERIDATFKDGILRLTLPKAEVAKPKRIEVKSA